VDRHLAVVALFRLVFTLAALAWTISAASHGANLAPMPMLLAAPPALLYLLIAAFCIRL
jgi:hypothetical protein